MPNQHNIESPVTLVGSGRSGSSLVGNIFERHPDFRMVGETANLIFGTWHAVEHSSGDIPALFEGYHRVLDEERAGRVVRQTFLTCFPDKQPRWFHKPIGVPISVMTKFGESQWSEAAEWYWKVMGFAFPNAKYFTLLRHPCDIVLSGRSYWGYNESTLWWSLGFMCYLLAHPASLVKFAISYDELVHNNEETLRKLFSYLEIPFHKNVLGAFSKVHVPSKGREKLGPGMLTRRNEWDKLDPAQANPLYLKPITELFDKFAYTLQLPEHFTEYHEAIATDAQTSNVSVVDSEVTKDQEIAELRKVIAGLNQQIEQIHVNNAKKEQERKLRVTWYGRQQRLVKLVRQAWPEGRRQGREVVRYISLVIQSLLRRMQDLRSHIQYLKRSRR